MKGRGSQYYLNKENKGACIRLLLMQRAFDRLKSSRKVLVFGINSRIVIAMQILKYKEFQLSDMITICMPTTKCAKSHEIDDLYL